MKTEIQPQDSSRAEAFRLWMSSPMPMVTLVKTMDVCNALSFHFGWRKRLRNENRDNKLIY